MGLIKSKSEPAVIKSKETVAEINSAAQARLEAKRRANKEYEAYLFGTGMKTMPKRKAFVISTKFEEGPRFVYK